MALVALVAFAAAVAGIGAPATFGAQTTADEPHYLLTAISLAEDGDLDVADEFREGAYRPFHALDLAPQAAAGDGGRLVEPHDPLLPVLLAVPAALGGWVLAKLVLCAAAAALAALTLWIAVRRFDVPVMPAAGVVGVLAASAPLAAYGSQVYPEIVAALVVAIAVAALTGRMGRAGLIVLAVAVVALPWLSVKYAPVAAALAGLALWRLARDRRTGAAIGLGAGLVLAAVVYVVAHHALYGGATPYAAGAFFVDGQLTVVGSDPDYAGRSRRIVGLLVDRDFGIAAWQPAWLLLVPALGAMAARRPRGGAAIALPLAAGWFVATFVALTMQGWWFPGRQLVVVLPLAVVAIAWWAREGGRRLGVALGLGAIGVIAQAWVAAEAVWGDLTWVVNLQDTGNPLYRAWAVLLPDYLDVTPMTWVLHGAWTAGAVAAAALAYRSARRDVARRPPQEGARASAPALADALTGR
ncbi:MAG: hypothetical protein JHC74_04815 [Thermoleophilia bacterium]|nr:hypothetical protein [Thermoleophilia bacterium]